MTVMRAVPGKLRVEAELRRLADVVGGLVERHLQRVGRVRRGDGAVPAGVELDARSRRRVVVLDRQAIAAPVDVGGDLRRRVGGEIDGAAVDARGVGDQLVVPAAVAVVPLVVALQPLELPFDAGLGGARTVGRDHDRLEGGGGALADVAVEQRLDADHRRAWNDRAGEGALDGAAVGVGEPHDEVGGERMGRRFRCGQRHVERRLAVGVGGRVDLERLARRLDALFG